MKRKRLIQQNTSKGIFIASIIVKYGIFKKDPIVTNDSDIKLLIKTGKGTNNTVISTILTKDNIISFTEWYCLVFLTNKSAFIYDKRISSYNFNISQSSYLLIDDLLSIPCYNEHVSGDTNSYILNYKKLICDSTLEQKYKVEILIEAFYQTVYDREIIKFIQSIFDLENMFVDINTAIIKDLNDYLTKIFIINVCEQIIMYDKNDPNIVERISNLHYEITSKPSYF